MRLELIKAATLGEAVAALDGPPRPGVVVVAEITVDGRRLAVLPLTTLVALVALASIRATEDDAERRGSAA